MASPADRSDTTSVFVRAAWLYTRAAESVRIEVREEPARFILVVHGPGQEWHHEVCVDYLDATQAQLAYEARVLAQGFMLEGFEQWQPQRRTPRPAPGGRHDVPTLPDVTRLDRPSQA